MGVRVAGVKKSFPISTGKEPHNNQRMFHFISPLGIYPCSPSQRHNHLLTSQLTCLCNSTGHWREAMWEEPVQL